MADSETSGPCEERVKLDSSRKRPPAAPPPTLHPREEENHEFDSLPQPAPPILGIVIPTLNEEGTLPRLLEDLRGLTVPHRVVVADGGSRDGTRQAGLDRGARIVEAQRGRGRQMNTGAAVLDTPWLLFLHADVRVPEETLRALEIWLNGSDIREFATFRFSLEGDQWFWRFIELGQRIRERTTGLAYGDQGLLLSRALFQEVRGFPDLPLMEDVEILRSLKKEGRWRRMREPILASPRRYQVEGRWRGWFRNTALITLHLAGVAPARLAAFYPPAGGPEVPDGSSRNPPGESTHLRGTRTTTARDPLQAERILLIFAKEPRPGHVKTRLAAEIGAEEAARIYRQLGKSVVDQLRHGPYTPIVFFDPPEARKQVIRWLGSEGLEFLPQVPGDLGSRLKAAFREGFRRGEKVVVVGTDAPEVDSEAVRNAFRQLAEADLVLGPAVDGGYYLLGLKSAAPELFHDIPWSTPEVLGATLDRAGSLGLRIATLPPLSDVDTAEDLRAWPTGRWRNSRGGDPVEKTPRSLPG
ncbi:MAG: TIGR04283 family arsenosugar biosynthesis glycosyltransferase [Longimicrobiales bacterium]